MSDTESMSERELAEDLFENVFSGQPKSVGEALEAADEVAPEVPEPPVEEAPPLVVTDEPVQPEADAPTEPAPELGEPADEPTEVAEEEELEPEELEDENVVWAKRKYGDAPEQWARAARHQEQHISKLSNELKEAQELASQWYQYAQQAEQQAQQVQPGMPLSAQEENWVDQAMSNPYAYAQQAAFQGNGNLFNAVLERVAEENPMLAGQISAQVQQDLQAAAVQQQAQQQPPPEMQLPVALAQSFQRLGLDLREHGPALSEKVGELGEYHPYVQAMLKGDDAQRDLAVQAVHDLVRSTTLTRRRVPDARQEAIKREGELRREAAGVVAGSPHTPPAQQQDPFMQAMEEEWKARGQWGEE